MIRSHEKLLELITDYGGERGMGEAAVEMLAEIDKTLFDLYDLQERVAVLAGIGALEGCRLCDEALELIRLERGKTKG